MKNIGKPGTKYGQTSSSGHVVTFAVLRDTVRVTTFTMSMVLQGNVAQCFPVSGLMHLFCRYLVKLHGPGVGQVQPSLQRNGRE